MESIPKEIITPTQEPVTQDQTLVKEYTNRETKKTLLEVIDVDEEEDIPQSPVDNTSLLSDELDK